MTARTHDLPELLVWPRGHRGMRQARPGLQADNIDNQKGETYL